MLSQTNSSFILNSSINPIHRPSADYSLPHTLEPTVCNGPHSSSTEILSSLIVLTEKPLETPPEILIGEPSGAEHRESEGGLPQQFQTDIRVSSEDKSEEHTSGTNQMDERRLKCQRSFEEILCKKKNCRCSFASETLFTSSTFSQEDYQPGSHQHMYE